MTQSHLYKVDLIPDLPEEGYRKGVGQWEGVCIHETACPGDSDESNVAYFKKNWRTRRAFVHAFIDEDSMTQTAKWAYKSWGCGTGNSRFINLEMCSYRTQAEFETIYNQTCRLAASKLFERKLGVVDGVTLVSHAWVSRNLGGTTHTDPIQYLKRAGKTWADMVADVKQAYDSLSKSISTPQPPAAAKCDVYVNDRQVSTDGYVEDGRTYVPVRKVGEALGAKVGFTSNASGKTVSINGKPLDARISSSGTSYAWSVDLALASQAKIEWDHATKTIHFTN